VKLLSFGEDEEAQEAEQEKTAFKKKAIFRPDCEFPLLKCEKRWWC